MEQKKAQTIFEDKEVDRGTGLIETAVVHFSTVKTIINEESFRLFRFLKRFIDILFSYWYNCADPGFLNYCSLY